LFLIEHAKLIIFAVMYNKIANPTFSLIYNIIPETGFRNGSNPANTYVPDCIVMQLNHMDSLLYLADA